MKRLFSILILFIFCFYAFTFKTHYCYHHEGGRYHGDCQAHMDEDHHEENHHEEDHQYLYPSHYECHDFLKDGLFQLTKKHAEVKQEIKFLVAFVVCLNSGSTYQQEFFPQPDPHCKEGPPLLFNSLRGPPII